MKVLILEDEESIRSFIRVNLKRQDIQVVEASTGEEAINRIEKERDIDIAVLDVGLPTISGFDVCRILRRSFPRLGIIMLTARTQDVDRVLGLEGGADDYVCKPFSPTELIARLRALYRRMHATAFEQEGKLSSGPFTLSSTERKLWKLDQEIELTPTEYALVKLFLEHVNISFSRDQILNEVWGNDYPGEYKTVDVNIRRLRSKLEDDPSVPCWIETVWGTGYRWKEESDATKKY
ncbi:Alkaline phosphatase synthesis transcriptional regulatory protein PhoP [compost metagenome]